MPVYVFDLTDDTQAIDDGLADNHALVSTHVYPDLVRKWIEIHTYHFGKLEKIGSAAGRPEQVPQSLIFLLKGHLGLY